MNEQVSAKVSANGKKSNGETDGRRSTRLFQAVPLNIHGQNGVGNRVSESMSTLSVNCHGCLYPSRHGYHTGDWLTLDVIGQHLGGKTNPVRAQVKFVRLPRTPRELFLVGVELETPANIWGIQSPPSDWLQFTNAAASLSESPELQSPIVAQQPSLVAQDASTIFSRVPVASAAVATVPDAKTNGASAIEKIFSSEDLVNALGGMLQQAAEKAVASAISSRLTPAVNHTAKLMVNFSQSCVRKVEEHCNQTRERFVALVQQDFRARMEAEIAQTQEQLQERLRKQVETSLVTAHEVTQQLEKSAAELPSRLAEARSILQQAGSELQVLCTRVRETAGRTATEFRDETIRFSGEQLGSLNQRMQETTGEAYARFVAAADESLEKLQAAAKAETERLAGAVRQNAESSMAVVAAEWEARQRASQEQITHSVQVEIDQFRRRLESILNSSMATAVAAANEHSRILMDSLLKGTAEQLKNSNSETVPG